MKMYCKQDLINESCECAERSERLRRSYEEKSMEYLQGRIDQYDQGFMPNIPLVGRLLQSQEIRVMKSVLEEKILEENL